MKPGSGRRCRSKLDHLRCRRHRNHEGKHRQKLALLIIEWEDPR